MKRFAVGCLIVVVLLAVCGGIGGYWLYSRARSYVGQFQALEKLDKNVTNIAAFAAPVNGELSADMVRRFVSVQESMQTRLGARLDEMKAKQDAFLKRQQAEHREASASEAIAVVTDMMKLVLEGKTAQVEALNQQGFSLAEYAWVKGQVYSAAGIEIVALRIPNSVSGLGQQGGVLTKPPDEGSAAVPARNKALVASLLPKLKDWAPLAFFGL